MNDLIKFLISEEAILVYIVALIVSIIYVFYCIIKNTSHKRKQKQNTMELNRLVEKVGEQKSTIQANDSVNSVLPVQEVEKLSLEDEKVVVSNTLEEVTLNSVDISKQGEEVVKNEEILMRVDEVVTRESLNQNVEVELMNSKVDVDDDSLKTINVDMAISNDVKPEVIEAAISVREELSVVKEEQIEDIPCIKIIEEIDDDGIMQPGLLSDGNVVEKQEVNTNSDEKIIYTSIEPEQEEAKKQLKEITEKLENEKEEENIELTEFEKMQEDTAIISLDELMQKAGEIYERNEEIQYQDEGNEPISLADLEKRKSEVMVVKESLPEVVLEPIESIDTKITTVSQLKPISKEHKFKSSPVISSVYGIESEKKQISKNTELELENTANFEKLDAEIRKTNQFIAVLKELQKKLD